MFMFNILTGSSNTDKMQSAPHPRETSGRDIPVSENSDRTLTVNEYETIRGVDDKKERRLKETQTFDVNSVVLSEKSDYFASMFRYRWREASAPIVLEDTPRSIEIWLRALHESLDGISIETVTIEEMWFVILAGDKYNFSLQQLSAWFSEWFDLQKTKKERGDYADLKENEFEKRLLYPCFKFDCASGFQALTKHLVYDVGGHVEETNPTSARQMHLPPRIIQQLNAARGRLRTMLHRQLFDQIKYIMDCDSCACKEATVYHYEHELRRIDIWPMEDTTGKASANVMLEQLQDFDEADMRRRIADRHGQEPLCRLCDRSWSRVVEKAIEVVRGYFDGLCLDCMDNSKSMTGRKEYHDDYWRHNEFRDRYDARCRIRHGEPTWYFSFMGRRERSGLAG